MSSKKHPEPPAPAVRRVPSQRPGPAGGKRDQNRRRRLAELCDAALALFLERGIEAVTIDEIARAAGMAKGNFYRYVEDKRDLVDALIAPVAAAIDAAMDRCEASTDAATDVAGLNAAYMRLALDLLQVYIAHRDLVRLYLQEARVPGVGARAPVAELEQRVTARTIALTRVAHEHALLAKIPPEVSALAVIGATERLLLAHLRDGIFEDEAQIATSLVRMVMEGITG
ncbi:MAG: TetR/AcrR family transcriptional regulator [Deltaproteobacteria bacterium]|nr:MAG: TetR/AcrR family transcriptional regulator [Deltaproteobacteria bacterium]